ncbi:Interferon-stimulated 20 kDa exonuclease-like 2 [Seminavis robusta]|uniref:RNA exonuclease 4 n=1 Tax=Seminavis robusta TaxID=568900 RepID=A0A9N8DMR0_9STRA|nr:Interferon-stimulated 20 kDa exonuclease-like 2 [Seminavis robusta]|eukprot:Sro246_g097710.1 Interferon-stimulated 20 kDa exonuclease-like 2 (353) ;mRNA; r:42112-43170
MAKTAFFSKKQKAEFRKRRKRLKESHQGTEGESKNDPKETTKEEETPTRDIDEKQAPVDKPQLPPNLVIVPKNLSSKEAKKFRKDARRNAKTEGNDPDKLEFIVEGNVPTSTTDDNNANNIPPKHKKRKREFPRLNDLVREEEKAKQKAAADSSRQTAEQALSEEYKSRYLALDCEMVGIGTDGKRSVLARVSIVDWDGNTLLDTFVQVPTRVTDFRTHVSGVTAKDIKSKSGAMKEKECREKVANLLKGKVLVGHALKNDLHALLLTHPKSHIRDTAKFRPFQRLGGSKWRPRKLRDLVQENLGLAIQQEGQAHDSIQDAWATMQLFRLVREQWEEDLKEAEQKAGKRRRT